MRKLVIMFSVMLLLSIFFFTNCGTTQTITQTVTPSSSTPLQAIPCEEAKYHIGERTTVYGVVASTNYATGSKGKPTFLNVGTSSMNE